MVSSGFSPRSSFAMTRFLPLLVIAGLAWSTTARAQMSAADLLTRIDRLEAEIRDLTGQVEQLQYRNHQLEQEVQRFESSPGAAAAPRSGGPPPAPTVATSPQASYGGPSYGGGQGTGSYPPSAPYGGGAPQASDAYPPPAQGAAPLPAPVATSAPVIMNEPTGTRRGDAFDPALNPSAPGAPRALGGPGPAEPPPPVAPSGSIGNGRPTGAPLDLSTMSSGPSGTGASQGGALPPPPPSNTSGTGAGAVASIPPTLPPSNSPKDQYDLAYGYVLHKDYALASDTFRDFLRKYPSDRQTPEAQYWLGESLYQQQQYRDAAEAFLAVSTKYENSSRAPDALLRLGQSLAALGEKEAACASLGEVLRNIPCTG